MKTIVKASLALALTVSVSAGLSAGTAFAADPMKKKFSFGGFPKFGGFGNLKCTNDCNMAYMKCLMTSHKMPNSPFAIASQSKANMANMGNCGTIKKICSKGC